jgi:hypothetical protein
VTAAAALVTVPAAELTTDPATLVTALAALLRGPLAEEAIAGLADEEDEEPVSAEAVDVTPDSAPGCSSAAVAWACREKNSRMKRIPAAAIANCAARRAARCASSCDIDSSYRRRSDRALQGQESPGPPMHGQ